MSRASTRSCGWALGQDGPCPVRSRQPNSTRRAVSRAHAKRMGPAYRRMGEARGETVNWSDTLVKQVTAERRAILSSNALPARARWRSRAVARLVAARDKLTKDEPHDG